MLATIFVVILTVIYVKYYHINFPFDCNSCCVVYLLTYQVYLKQYLGSTEAS